jgi:hypothetical protein
MDGIRIEVTGNIVRVTGKPSKITSGTVGLPVEFTFDSQWDELKKIAVFRAGDVVKSVENPSTVPWEVLEKPDVWLSVGVYGTNSDGSIVIPTIWANVCPIHVGVDPDGDPTTDPTPSVWQTVLEYLANLTTKPASKIGSVTLLASAWEGSDRLYSQVVALDGVTAYSQVDLKPSAEQLTIFHEKDIAFATENDDGVVTVYVIGDKPLNDYTMQVSITEVVT